MLVTKKLAAVAITAHIASASWASTAQATGEPTCLGTAAETGALVAGAVAVAVDRMALPGDAPVCNTRQVGDATRGLWHSLVGSKAEAQACIPVDRFFAQRPDQMVAAGFAETRAELSRQLADIDRQIASEGRDGVGRGLGSGRDEFAQAQRRLADRQTALAALRSKAESFANEGARASAGAAELRARWKRDFESKAKDNPLLGRIAGVIETYFPEGGAIENPFTARNEVLAAIADSVPEADAAKLIESFRAGYSRAASEAQAAALQMETEIAAERAALGRMAASAAGTDALQASREAIAGRIADVDRASLVYLAAVTKAGATDADRIAAAAKSATELHRLVPESLGAQALVTRAAGVVAFQQASAAGSRAATAPSVAAALRTIAEGTLRRVGGTAGKTMARVAVMAALGGVSLPALAAEEIGREVLKSSGIPCSLNATEFFSWDRSGHVCTANPGTPEQTAQFLALERGALLRILKYEPKACEGLERVISRYDRRSWRARCGTGSVVLERPAPPTKFVENLRISRMTIDVDASTGGARTATVDYSGGSDGSRRCARVALDDDGGVSNARLAQVTGARTAACDTIDPSRFSKEIRATNAEALFGSTAPAAIGPRDRRQNDQRHLTPNRTGLDSSRAVANANDVNDLAVAAARMARFRVEAAACCTGRQDCQNCAPYGITSCPNPSTLGRPTGI